MVYGGQTAAVKPGAILRPHAKDLRRANSALGLFAHARLVPPPNFALEENAPPPLKPFPLPGRGPRRSREGEGTSRLGSPRADPKRIKSDVAYTEGTLQRC